MAKVKQNLDLLREQYVRLQARYNELEQKHNKLLASSGGEGGSADGYVSRLIAMSNGLYDKPLYRFVCVSMCPCTCICVYSLCICIHIRTYIYIYVCA